MAALTGGGLTWSGLVLAVAIIAVTIYVPAFAVRRWRQKLGVRLSRRRLPMRRRIFRLVVFVVFVGVACGLEWVLPLGTPLAYAVEFLAAAVILGTYLAVNTRDPVGNDAARLVTAQDLPGQFDELIGSRSRLRLCASLAAIEEIELGLLAHCLQQHPDALTPHIAELTAAQYVCVRHDAGRDWISLTSEGRTRCRRHLAALLAVTA